MTDHAEKSGAGAPKCKLCQTNHWLRVGCDGQAQGTLAAKPAAVPTSAERVTQPPRPMAKRRKTKRKAKRGARKQ